MRTLFLDTATTGLRGAYAGGKEEIVELAVLDDDGVAVINQLVHPARRKSWLDAERIHGISPAMVVDAPTLETLLPALSAIIRGCRVVNYDTANCLQFLPKDVFADSLLVCAMLGFAKWKRVWSFVDPSYNWHELDVAAKATGYSDGVASHRALAATMACRHVWHYLERN